MTAEVIERTQTPSTQTGGGSGRGNPPRSTDDRPENPGCKACWYERSKQGLPPRPLIPLPQTTDEKDLVVLVCERCDGEALANARRLADNSSS